MSRSTPTLPKPATSAIPSSAAATATALTKTYGRDDTAVHARASSAAMRCMSVDLPDPEGPMMAVSSAAAKDTVTSSRSRTARGTRQPALGFLVIAEGGTRNLPSVPPAPRLPAASPGVERWHPARRPKERP
jgi:hypothetical protein